MSEETLGVVDSIDSSILNDSTENNNMSNDNINNDIVSESLNLGPPGSLNLGPPDELPDLTSDHDPTSGGPGAEIGGSDDVTGEDAGSAAADFFSNLQTEIQNPKAELVGQNLKVTAVVTTVVESNNSETRSNNRTSNLNNNDDDGTQNLQNIESQLGLDESDIPAGLQSDSNSGIRNSIEMDLANEVLSDQNNNSDQAGGAATNTNSQFDLSDGKSEIISNKNHQNSSDTGPLVPANTTTLSSGATSAAPGSSNQTGTTPGQPQQQQQQGRGINRRLTEIANSMRVANPLSGLRVPFKSGSLFEFSEAELNFVRRLFDEEVQPVTRKKAAVPKSQGKDGKSIESGTKGGNSNSNSKKKGQKKAQPEINIDEIMNDKKYKSVADYFPPIISGKSDIYLDLHPSLQDAISRIVLPVESKVIGKQLQSESALHYKMDQFGGMRGMDLVALSFHPQAILTPSQKVLAAKMKRVIVRNIRRLFTIERLAIERREEFNRQLQKQMELVNLLNSKRSNNDTSDTIQSASGDNSNSDSKLNIQQLQQYEKKFMSSFLNRLELKQEAKKAEIRLIQSWSEFWSDWNMRSKPIVFPSPPWLEEKISTKASGFKSRHTLLYHKAIESEQNKLLQMFEKGQNQQNRKEEYPFQPCVDAVKLMKADKEAWINQIKNSKSWHQVPDLSLGKVDKDAASKQQQFGKIVDSKWIPNWYDTFVRNIPAERAFRSINLLKGKNQTMAALNCSNNSGGTRSKSRKFIEPVNDWINLIKARRANLLDRDLRAIQEQGEEAYDFLPVDSQVQNYSSTTIKKSDPWPIARDKKLLKKKLETFKRDNELETRIDVMDAKVSGIRANKTEIIQRLEKLKQNSEFQGGEHTLNQPNSFSNILEAKMKSPAMLICREINRRILIETLGRRKASKIINGPDYYQRSSPFTLDELEKRRIDRVAAGGSYDEPLYLGKKKSSSGGQKGGDASDGGKPLSLIDQLKKDDEDAKNNAGEKKPSPDQLKNFNDIEIYDKIFERANALSQVSTLSKVKAEKYRNIIRKKQEIISQLQKQIERENITVLIKNCRQRGIGPNDPDYIQLLTQIQNQSLKAAEEKLSNLLKNGSTLDEITESLTQEQNNNEQNNLNQNPSNTNDQNQNLNDTISGGGPQDSENNMNKGSNSDPNFDNNEGSINDSFDATVQGNMQESNNNNNLDPNFDMDSQSQTQIRIGETVFGSNTGIDDNLDDGRENSSSNLYFNDSNLMQMNTRTSNSRIKSKSETQTQTIGPAKTSEFKPTESNIRFAPANYSSYDNMDDANEVTGNLDLDLSTLNTNIANFKTEPAYVADAFHTSYADQKTAGRDQAARNQAMLKALEQTNGRVIEPQGGGLKKQMIIEEKKRSEGDDVDETLQELMKDLKGTVGGNKSSDDTESKDGVAGNSNSNNMLNFDPAMPTFGDSEREKKLQYDIAKFGVNRVVGSLEKPKKDNIKLSSNLLMPAIEKEKEEKNKNDDDDNDF